MVKFNFSTLMVAKFNEKGYLVDEQEIEGMANLAQMYSNINDYVNETIQNYPELLTKNNQEPSDVIAEFLEWNTYSYEILQEIDDNEFIIKDIDPSGEYKLYTLYVVNNKVFNDKNDIF